MKNYTITVNGNVIKRRNNENQENQHNKYGADSDDCVHAGLADQNALCKKKPEVKK